MASTPSAQIRGEAHTPPTPLHGSAYHSKSSPSRHSARLAAKNTSDSTQSSFAQSPQASRFSRSPQHSDFHSEESHSQVTPKRKSTRHARVISPFSPDSDTNIYNPTQQHNPSFLSATTVLAEGMLPTPVKTPQKKQVPNSTMAARALFQDNMLPSPRKSQKKKRHNGFSLESLSENNPANNGIQIHVDSQDQVPELDASEDNPFYELKPESKRRHAASAQKVSGTSKRRKVSEEQVKQARQLDPQVEDAIEKDDGMVYVFRGKKVFRRFEDAGDEEEVIDPEELGLLEREINGRDIVKPLKTLTRKSIKPRRLFQEEAKAKAAAKKQISHTDEEAETEIEDNLAGPVSLEEEMPSPSRATRSRTRDVSKDGHNGKKRSPFDSWARVKPGSTGSSSGSVPPSRSRKRTAADALDI